MKPRTRGSNLTGVYGYLSREADPDQLKELTREWPSQLLAEVESFKHAGWYPPEWFDLVCIAIASLGETEAEARRHLIGAGRAIATNAVNTFMKLMLRMLTPGLIIRRLPDLWLRDNAFGELTVVDSRVEEGLVTMELRDAPIVSHLGPVGVGYVGLLFEHILQTDVAIDVEGWSVDQPRSDRLVWKLTWSV